MEKAVLQRVKEAEDFLAGNSSQSKEVYLAYLSRWIGYIQHERLIHLIVTVTFAALAFMCIIVFFLSNEIAVLGALFIFIVTLGFYIRHYFILENKTQYLYELYDKIEKLS
jgi:hypothetical protein